MRTALFNLLLVSFSFLIFYTIDAQTLMINEVSQGEFGNQEYVELVVVDNTVVYDCQNTQPPCIDIRGWIFDDNSGYHGTSGIASGAVRFSFDNLWSCVPLGTIILIYNSADPNPQLPADDISLSDGNCSIIAPISNTTLFESNTTTPGAIACSYPAAGWTPGGDWSNTLLANGGDCARIVDVAGCEVFSVCWGTNNQNNLIYFSGGSTSATSATNTVYFFNGSDPSVQANWTIGCADVTACGVENQTPGAPNNATNAAYISQFNNNCMPITPLVSSAVVNNDASCICNGQATASGSGSIPGYTYEWFDNLFVPIGQTNATATNLCAGTYNVIVTSSIGCADTSQVTINGTTSVTVTVNSESICAGETAVLTGTPSSSGGVFVWSPTGESTASISVTPTTTSSYMVYYSIGTCIDSAQAIVTVNPAPVINAGSDVTLCSGETTTLTATGGTSYVWDNGITNGVTFTPTPGTTIYTVTGTNASGCSATDAVSVTVDSAPIINAGNDLTLCEGQTATLTASGGTSYTWDNGISNGTPFTPGLGTTIYTVTGTNASGCSATDAVSITVLSNPTANASFTPTSGTAPLLVDFTNLSSGGTTYSWNFGNGQAATTAGTWAVSTSYEAGSYQITLIATNGSCQSTWTGFIEVVLGDPAIIEVPNVFTPNDDKVNDFFLINSENLISLEGIILNRWGNELFTFNTIDFEWDGTSKGEKVIDGTYFIMYRAFGLDQKVYEGHTFFQLIR